MSEMELIERASAKDEIRQALAELERQKPKNMEAFESREAEIRRLLELLALTRARARGDRDGPGLVPGQE